MSDNAMTLGYIGLGNMGTPMVVNMLKAGLGVCVHDKAGTAERAPEGADVADSIAELSAQCSHVFVCVPDGPAVCDVVRDIVEGDGRVVEVIVNLSTTGIAAAQEANGLVEETGIRFVDAPVSGGRAGSIRGTITLMWSGDEAVLETMRPALETFTGSIFHVGPRPGQGQALKLLNNFLSAVAMTATSEAMVFGASQGLEMKTMLDAVNVSTGRNTATSDKFPNRILTGTFDAGFHMALMEKDVALYLKEVQTAGTADRLGRVLADYWKRGTEAYPDGDFTNIFKLVQRESGSET